MDIVLENYLNGICCGEIVEPFNFDVTGNWATGDANFPVTDQASFETFLSSRSNNNTNNLTNIVITDFELVNGRLRCNLTADGTILDISYMQVTEVLGVGNLSSLQSLNLDSNQIVDFNPTIALPSSLQFLFLNSNQIETFNPTIALPNSLADLFLNSNQIQTFNPTIALPNSLVYLVLINNQIETFNPTIALPNSLVALNLSNNQIETFNPTIALPSILQSLYLNYNQMTTSSYTEMETWANAQPSFTNGCAVYFNNNINSVNGTNLKTILVSKNCNVSA
jgi:Leucine-rich repeat (LRR) protein